MAIFHQAKYHYGQIYIHNDVHNNVWKFCGDHILITFFFGCINIQKYLKKYSKRSDNNFSFTEDWQGTDVMFVSYVCKKPKMIHPWGRLVPTWVLVGFFVIVFVFYWFILNWFIVVKILKFNVLSLEQQWKVNNNYPKRQCS